MEMQSFSFFQGLIEGLQKGDFAVVGIVICGVIALAFSIERLYRLFLQYSLDGSSFMYEIQKYILANDLDGAIRVCNGAGKAAVAKVIKAGLQRASRDESQIQNAVDAASLEMVSKLERRIPYLAAIANVATMIGLLGTISGLILSFQAISTAEPAQRQAMLGVGISQAMNATKYGLVVAIFAMIVHSLCSNKAARILEEIDEFGVKLLDLLSARKYRHSSEKE